MKLWKQLYLGNRFFLLFGAITILFMFGFVWNVVFVAAQAILALAIAIVIADIFILFQPEAKILAERKVPRLLSLGDEQHVELLVHNLFHLKLNIELIDELPIQFQERNFRILFELEPEEKKLLQYTLRPLERGEYAFGAINIFTSSSLGLVRRRFRFPQLQMVPVYPSIIQMKHFELKAVSKISNYQGVKKMRRIGHSYEFERIKNYVQGDDFRSINWKATGRRGSLMVNLYEDERAQQVYCIIDKSRSMKLQFNGLSLMDYAINTSLVISNIALQKQDKAGLVSFAENIHQTIKADRRNDQLNRILQVLYKQKEGQLEANYELLYQRMKNFITGRSLILLYTNFESSYALQRVLPILRRMNAFHLLVVVFFENTEIADYASEDSKNLEEIYLRTIARQFVSEKQQMAQTLRQYGIQTILTRPEDLSINTLNKYLELKSRGLI